MKVALDKAIQLLPSVNEVEVEVARYDLETGEFTVMIMQGMGAAARVVTAPLSSAVQDVIRTAVAAAISGRTNAAPTLPAKK